MGLNANKRSGACFRVGDATDGDCYSMMLLTVTMSRLEWLAEECLSGRISEKQFLEALPIQTSNHLTSIEFVREILRTSEP